MDTAMYHPHASAGSTACRQLFSEEPFQDCLSSLEQLQLKVYAPFFLGVDPKVAPITTLSMNLQQSVCHQGTEQNPLSRRLQGSSPTT